MGTSQIRKIFKEWPPFLMLRRSPPTRMRQLVQHAQDQCKKADKEDAEKVNISSKLLTSKLTENQEAKGFTNLVGFAMLNKITDNASKNNSVEMLKLIRS